MCDYDKTLLMAPTGLFFFTLLRTLSDEEDDKDVEVVRDDDRDEGLENGPFIGGVKSDEL